MELATSASSSTSWARANAYASSSAAQRSPVPGRVPATRVLAQLGLPASTGRGGLYEGGAPSAGPGLWQPGIGRARLARPQGPCSKGDPRSAWCCRGTTGAQGSGREGARPDSRPPQPQAEAAGPDIQQAQALREDRFTSGAAQGSPASKPAQQTSGRSRGPGLRGEGSGQGPEREGAPPARNSRRSRRGPSVGPSSQPGNPADPPGRVQNLWQRQPQSQQRQAQGQGQEQDQGQGHNCIIWDSITGAADAVPEAPRAAPPRVPLSVRPDYSSTLRRAMAEMDGPPSSVGGGNAPKDSRPAPRQFMQSQSQPQSLSQLQSQSESQPLAPSAPRQSAEEGQAQGQPGQRPGLEFRNSADSSAGGGAYGRVTQRWSGQGSESQGAGVAAQGRGSGEGTKGEVGNEASDCATCPEDAAILRALQERRTNDALRMLRALLEGGGAASMRSWSRCVAQLSMQGRLDDALGLFDSTLPGPAAQPLLSPAQPARGSLSPPGATALSLETAPLRPQAPGAARRAETQRGQFRGSGRDLVGAAEEALQLVLDEDALSQLVLACAKKRRFQAGQRVLEAMLGAGFQPRVNVWSALVAAMSKDPVSAPAALALFDLMLLRASATPLVGAQGAAYGAQAGPGPWAMEAASGDEPLNASWPDTGAFNAALNAAVNCRQLAVAEALLEVRMPQLGVAPDFRSFNILLKGYAAAGEGAKFRALYARMQTLGVHRDVSTSNTLIAGFAALGDLRAAEAALHELEAASAFSSGPGLARPQQTQGRPIGATTRTLTTLLKAFVEADRWDRALLIFEGMKRNLKTQPNEVTYGTLINGLVSKAVRQAGRAGGGGRLEGATRALPSAAALLSPQVAPAAAAGERGYRAQASGIEAELGTSVARILRPQQQSAVALQSTAQGSLLAALPPMSGAEERVKWHWGEVLAGSALGASPAQALPLDVPGEARKGPGPRSLMAQALRLLSEMQDRGVPVSSPVFNMLLKGLCALGMPAEAEQVLAAMREQGVGPTAATYNTLISWHAQGGQAEGAWQWFARMREEGVEVSREAYTTVLGLLAQQGDVARAGDVFCLMRDADGVGADAVAWSAMAAAFARNGQSEQAWQLYREMKEQGIVPTLAAYGSLVHVLRAADRAPESLVVWRDLMTRMDKERRSLSSAQGRSTPFPASPPLDMPSAAAMGGRGEEQAGGGGRRGGAVRGLFKGQGVAPFPALIPDEGIMDDLVHVCVRAGYFQRALEVVSVMEEVGMSPNRTKYRRMFIDLYCESSEEEDPGAPWQGPDVAAVGGRSFEAFKFWLGLPNDLYQSEWDWREP